MGKDITLSLFGFLTSCAKKQTIPVMYTLKIQRLRLCQKWGFSAVSLILQARQEVPKMGILLAACWGEIPKPLGAKPYGFCT